MWASFRLGVEGLLGGHGGVAGSTLRCVGHQGRRVSVARPSEWVPGLDCLRV